MLESQRRELIRLIPMARRHAAKFGPMHSAWEMIFDGEALLSGQEPMVNDPAWIIRELQRYDENKHCIAPNNVLDI